MFLERIKDITTNDGATFTLYALKVTKSKLLATRITMEPEDLSLFSKECLKYLVEKQYHQKDIKEYPHGIPKDHIETLTATSTLVSARYQELLTAVS